MKPMETITVNPNDIPLSVRPDEVEVITSLRAGKVVPFYASPLLREDRISKGTLRVAIKTEETIHPLQNAVKAVVSVFFIPYFAFDRFKVGMDAFNRSYQGQPEAHNGTPIQFFSTIAFDRAHEIWKCLGVHEAQGATVNASYIEAYNVMINFRRKARSTKIALRTALDTTLAQAFWHNPNLDHIVPEFEQAMMDGNAVLTLNGRAPVSGIGVAAANAVVPTGSAGGYRDTSNNSITYANSIPTSTAGSLVARVLGSAAATARADIWAELQGITGTVSLANIELAKQTAAMAKLREQYNGLSEEHIMDLLMDGIRVPDEMLRQPILLAQQSSVFGFNQRYATDSANLGISRSNGMTTLSINYRTPPMNTGGIVMACVEIVPEPLFERMQDRFLRMNAPANLPAFVRDFLDPDKVEVVENRFVDALHSTPTGVFGYAPLNHSWKRNLRRVGGKFYRPNPDTFVEDRQRFWSVEKLNPALVTDFYLVPAALPHSVFADSLADPFELFASGETVITGRTQFGQVLSEDNANYSRVDSQVDKTRVVSV